MTIGIPRGRFYATESDEFTFPSYDQQDKRKFNNIYTQKHKGKLSAR